MKLSKQQSDAAIAVKKWYQSNEQVFCLNGYAGTGKSTIVGELLNDFSSFNMVTPTGKAAFVLAQKTGLEVKTIHSLLYNPLEKFDFVFMELKEKLTKDPDNKKLQKMVKNYRNDDEKVDFLSKGLKSDKSHVYICDEASMIGTKLWNDLIATGAKILFVGDTAQLPPVRDTAQFHKAEKGAVLTEVHRQAADSAILRMATAIRNGEFLDPRDFTDGEAIIIEAKNVNHDIYLQADKVITDTNAARHRLNKFARKRLGFDGLVKQGETLICTANDWKYTPLALINGVEARVLKDGVIVDDTSLIIEMDYLGEVIKPLVSDHLLKANYGNGRYVVWEDLQGMKQFDYGYALTVHKSQGSEWENVVFADSSGIFGSSKKDKRRLAYTAITRASNQFIWVLK